MDILYYAHYIVRKIMHRSGIYIQKMFTLIIVIIKSINTFQKRHMVYSKNIMVFYCNEVNEMWHLNPKCHMFGLTNKPP